jgi:hypothetical protein
MSSSTHSTDEDIDMEGEGEGAEAFHLPTAEEREQEKNYAADVQRRMRACAHQSNVPNFVLFNSTVAPFAPQATMR